MKNKGFTLIELLAVIIIIGLIAVIVIPKITDSVESSKQNLAKTNALNYSKAINEQTLKERLNDNVVKLNGEYSINSNGNMQNENTEFNLEYSGQKPKNGYLTYNNNELQNACITIDKYAVILENDEVTSIEKGDCTEIQTLKAQAETEVANYITALLADNTIQAYTEDTSKKVSEINTPAAPAGVDGNSWIYFKKETSSVTASDYSIKITKGKYTFIINCVGETTPKSIYNKELTTQKKLFADASWAEIKANLAANRNAYPIGSEKIVNMNLEGTAKDYKLRLSNTESCSSSWEGSKTACGVVIEFVTTLGLHVMNETATSEGGWYASNMRTYLNSGNNSIYSKLNAVIGKDSSNNDIIISTAPVISGSGYNQTSQNAEDYLYLLSTRELGLTEYNDYDNKRSASDTNILKYYIDNDNIEAVQKYNSIAEEYEVDYWLRSANCIYTSGFYFVIGTRPDGESANEDFYVAPAFRILD